MRPVGIKHFPKNFKKGLVQWWLIDWCLCCSNVIVYKYWPEIRSKLHWPNKWI